MRSVAVLFLLSVAGYLTYRTSFAGVLFFDDATAIEQNTHLVALVDPTTRWELRSWRHAVTAERDTPFAGRPVVALSFALNHWWASAMSPSGIADFIGVLPMHVPYYHYVNTALHILIAWLLYAVVRRTLLAPAFGERLQASAFWWALFGALLWLVHPLNTEAVVYVTQRTEQMVSLFLLLTIYASIRAADAPTPQARRGWQTLSIVCCVLGMASKENMIAAPLLMVAYDRAFRFGSWREAFAARRWFYLGLAATWGVLAAVMVSAPRGRSVGFAHEQFPWYEYLITQCWCLARYVGLAIVPLADKLCIDYGRRPVLDVVDVLPGAMMIGAALAATVWGWRHRPWLGFLGAWLFLILAPTSSFVPIITEVGAERRMYLPIVAVLASVVIACGMLWYAWTDFLRRRSADNGYPTLVRILGIIIAGGTIALLGLTSRLRTEVYLNRESLYGHVVRVMPDNDRGYNNYATVLMARNRHREALLALNQALRIQPEYSDAYSNRAATRVSQAGRRRLDMAISDGTEAMRWNPYDMKSTNNRGLAFFEARLFDPAVADFTRMIELTRGSVDAHLNRANVEIARAPDDAARMRLAADDVAAALKKNPLSLKAHLVQATIDNNLKQPGAALNSLDAALESFFREAATLARNPTTAPSLRAAERVLSEIDSRRRTPSPEQMIAVAKFPDRQTLAEILKERARAEKLYGEQENDPRMILRALDDLTRAIVFAPGDAELYVRRGELYLNTHRTGEASLDFAEVLKLDPNNRDALRGRVKLYTRIGDFTTAWGDAVRLRDLGDPLDEETLNTLRKASGRNDPPPSEELPEKLPAKPAPSSKSAPRR